MKNEWAVEAWCPHDRYVVHGCSGVKITHTPSGLSETCDDGAASYATVRLRSRGSRPASTPGWRRHDASAEFSG